MSAATRHSRDKKEVVTIHNSCAHPVMFRLPGKDVRLGPRSSMDIDKAFLASAALQRLLRANQIRVVEEDEAGADGVEGRPTVRLARVRRKHRARSRTTDT